MKRSYCDYNATAPLRPEARLAMHEAMESVANASSVHKEGRAARAIIEEARTDIADAIGAAASEIVFTSGGTEANHLGVFGALKYDPSLKPFYLPIEHSSLFAPLCEMTGTKALPISSDGLLCANALAGPDFEAAAKPFIIAMAANNETGALQSFEDLDLIKSDKVLRVHSDIVQLLGKVPLDLTSTPLTSASLSAHKVGGPQGIGALWLKDGAQISALAKGGGHESQRRAGTENLIGIAGFGAAIKAACAPQTLHKEAAHMQALRDRFEAELMAALPQTHIFSKTVARLPNTSCFAIKGISSETAVIALDMAGVAISAGSACSSGKVKPSHVIEALGFADLARASMRVSFGWDSKMDDVDHLLKALTDFARR